MNPGDYPKLPAGKALVKHSEWEDSFLRGQSFNGWRRDYGDCNMHLYTAEQVKAYAEAAVEEAERAMQYQSNQPTILLEEALLALSILTNEVEGNVCLHENTHRGGAIWTMCSDCDQKWADDRGGMPKFATSHRLSMAEVVSNRIKNYIKAQSQSSY